MAHRYSTKLFVIAVAAGACTLGLLGGGLRRSAALPRLAPDAPAPLSDARYLRATRLGLAHDYEPSRREFLALARDSRGTAAGVWALFQAAEICDVLHEPEQAKRLRADLLRDYPQHYLAARLRPAPASRPKTVSDSDCGPRALAFAGRELGLKADLATLRREAGTTSRGTTLEGLTKAAQAHGLQAEGIQVDLDALLSLTRPAVAWVDGDHFVAVLKIEGERVRIHDPIRKDEQLLEGQELMRRSGGVLLRLGHSPQRAQRAQRVL